MDTNTLTLPPITLGEIAAMPAAERAELAASIADTARQIERLAHSFYRISDCVLQGAERTADELYGDTRLYMDRAQALRDLAAQYDAKADKAEAAWLMRSDKAVGL